MSTFSPWVVAFCFLLLFIYTYTYTSKFPATHNHWVYRKRNQYEKFQGGNFGNRFFCSCFQEFLLPPLSDRKASNTLGLLIRYCQLVSNLLALSYWPECYCELLDQLGPELRFFSCLFKFMEFSKWNLTRQTGKLLCSWAQVFIGLFVFLLFGQTQELLPEPH